MSAAKAGSARASTPRPTPAVAHFQDRRGRFIVRGFPARTFPAVSFIIRFAGALPPKEKQANNLAARFDAVFPAGKRKYHCKALSRKQKYYCKSFAIARSVSEVRIRWHCSVTGVQQPAVRSRVCPSHCARQIANRLVGTALGLPAAFQPAVALEPMTGQRRGWRPALARCRRAAEARQVVIGIGVIEKPDLVQPLRNPPRFSRPEFCKSGFCEFFEHRSPVFLVTSQPSAATSAAPLSYFRSGMRAP